MHVHVLVVPVQGELSFGGGVAKPRIKQDLWYKGVYAV